MIMDRSVARNEKMPNSTFRETISYIAHQFKAEAPPGEEVELVLDDTIHVKLTSSKIEGGIVFRSLLGMFVASPSLEQIRDLNLNNFLGVNTAGCTLYLDPESPQSVWIKANSSPFTTPQENWEWLLRVLATSKAWTQELSQWEEFLPL